MSQDDTTPAEAAASSNRSILRKLVIVSVLMFGFGWALVPLYRKICEITGINVVTLRDADAGSAARNTQVDLSRTVTVEFDANARGAWSFRPHVSHLQVHPGELVQVTYDLVNLQDRGVAGQAIPSYAPMQSAQHFRKLECFCFTQQTLAAGETRQFPVVFFIDPALPADVQHDHAVVHVLRGGGRSGRSRSRGPAPNG